MHPKKKGAPLGEYMGKKKVECAWNFKTTPPIHFRGHRQLLYAR